jgi:D-glycero-alpha-D-manno-heptose 1-phosphate guanylyltransferase
VNGGVYLFRRATLADFPAKRPLSFEYDVFPALVSQGRKLKVVGCEAPFLDIGTEDTLAQAGDFIERNSAWFE